MTDLADRLRTAITQRRELAEEATPGPWAIRTAGTGIRGSTDYAWVTRPPDHAAIVERQNYGTIDDIVHIAANDPATVIRHCDADLALLDLHRFGGTPPLAAHDECRGCLLAWPCPTLLNRADAYQVEVTHG